MRERRTEEEWVMGRREKGLHFIYGNLPGLRKEENRLPHFRNMLFHAKKAHVSTALLKWLLRFCSVGPERTL